MFSMMSHLIRPSGSFMIGFLKGALFANDLLIDSLVQNIELFHLGPPANDKSWPALIASWLGVQVPDWLEPHASAG
jgi:hypothetical protein